MAGRKTSYKKSYVAQAREACAMGGFSNAKSEKEVLCSEENASLIRGALDLWTYHADERTYEEVMEEFEATTGLATPGAIPEKDVFKVLLFIWGKLSAALALKEAA